MKSQIENFTEKSVGNSLPERFERRFGKSSIEQSLWQMAELRRDQWNRRISNRTKSQENFAKRKFESNGTKPKSFKTNQKFVGFQTNRSEQEEENDENRFADRRTRRRKSENYCGAGRTEKRYCCPFTDVTLSFVVEFFSAFGNASLDFENRFPRTIDSNDSGFLTKSFASRKKITTFSVFCSTPITSLLFSVESQSKCFCFQSKNREILFESFIDSMKFLWPTDFAFRTTRLIRSSTFSSFTRFFFRSKLKVHRERNYFRQKPNKDHRFFFLWERKKTIEFIEFFLVENCWKKNISFKKIFVNDFVLFHSALNTCRK